MTYPSVKFDLQHRMLSVRLSDGSIAWTDQLDDAHLVDVDAEGRVVGLDILTLDNLRIDEMAERFDFSDQVPAIKAAIQNAMTPTPKTTASAGRPLIVQGTRVSDVSADAETDDSPHPPLFPPIVN